MSAQRSDDEGNYDLTRGTPTPTGPVTITSAANSTPKEQLPAQEERKGSKPNAFTNVKTRLTQFAKGIFSKSSNSNSDE